MIVNRPAERVSVNMEYLDQNVTSAHQEGSLLFMVVLMVRLCFLFFFAGSTGFDAFFLTSIAESITRSIPKPCSQVTCSFGAVCRERNRKAHCVCEDACHSNPEGHGGNHHDHDADGQVCGSNGQTYESECGMKLFSCRIQEAIFPVFNGPCKGNNNLSLLSLTFIHPFVLLPLPTSHPPIKAFFFLTPSSRVCEKGEKFKI